MAALVSLIVGPIRPNTQPHFCLTCDLCLCFTSPSSHTLSCWTQETSSHFLLTSVPPPLLPNLACASQAYPVLSERHPPPRPGPVHLTSSPLGPSKAVLRCRVEESQLECMLPTCTKKLIWVQNVDSVPSKFLQWGERRFYADLSKFNLLVYVITRTRDGSTAW